MNPDDELCMCFHVTRRKVENWIRLQKPKRAGQLSECFGAGTGCGWCRPFLERLFDQAQSDSPDADDLPSADEYSMQRASYRAKKKNDA
ncbi:(2Fe-2S)-binding protein [bacterium]|nr:(2Fe-2S)-binding protein [bacterium]